LNFRSSLLDGETLIVDVEDGDTGPVVETLDKRMNGFAVFGEGVEIPMAVIDKRTQGREWCTENHLLAIEAHELGHIRLKTSDEPTADRFAIDLLQSLGLNEAASLLIERGLA